MESLKLFIDFYGTPLSDKTMEAIIPLLKKNYLKKGDVIVKHLELSSKFYILISGVVRSFVTDDKGKERIRTLYVPITTTGPLSSLITNTKSDATYDCLTDCTLLEGSFSEIKRLINNHHDLSLFYSKALERSFIRTENRIYDLSVLNSTERYLKLKKKVPNIDNIIPQYHIASYLNITPVQLSRIRKELYSK